MYALTNGCAPHLLTALVLTLKATPLPSDSRFFRLRVAFRSTLGAKTYSNCPGDIANRSMPSICYFDVSQTLLYDSHTEGQIASRFKPFIGSLPRSDTSYRASPPCLSYTRSFLISSLELYPADGLRARCATRPGYPPETLARVTMLLILSSRKAAKRLLIDVVHCISKTSVSKRQGDVLPGVRPTTSVCSR